MNQILAADIGGTHARFTLAKRNNKHSFGIELANQKTYKSSSFSDVIDCISLYAESLTTVPKIACLAVAGPVFGDRVTLTNRALSFSIENIRAQFGFSFLEVINDYAAVAYATTKLDKRCVDTVKRGVADPSQPRVIVGAGTGLGASALVNIKGRWHAVASEVGHTSVFGTNEKERQILCHLAKIHGYLTAEKLISGPGIVSLYCVLAEFNGTSPTTTDSETILLNGLAGKDSLSVETLGIVGNLLGSFVGDLALTFCARGGVFLSGDIFRTLSAYLKKSDFTRHFVNKGAISGFVKEIPVYTINSSQPGLYGAAIRALCEQ